MWIAEAARRQCAIALAERNNLLAFDWATLPAREVVHAPACSCPSCDGELGWLGEDVTEFLEHRRGRFHVIRPVRPTFSCRPCEAITPGCQPDLPTERGRPGCGPLARTLHPTPPRQPGKPPRG